MDTDGPFPKKLLGMTTTCNFDYYTDPENPTCRRNWPVYNNTCEILMNPAWYFEYTAYEVSYCIGWM